jgi:hypothetical protein
MYRYAPVIALALAFALEMQELKGRLTELEKQLGKRKK